MKCRVCGSGDSKVIDSRSTDYSIRRRRECLSCGFRFTTYEEIEETPILVVKNDGNRQILDKKKIRTGIIKSCEKRPVSVESIDMMTNNIMSKIYSLGEREIPSKKIGELVMEELRKVDEVSYVRFASVYRSFTDISNFMEELQLIMKETKKDE